MANRTILYVTGFAPDLRARDLAWEFERYGRLVRCDIPALKNPTAQPFAFVEFRHEYDAEDAYYDMHGRSIDGWRISVQWAKRPPSSAWRHDGGYGGRGPRYGGRDDRGGDWRRRDSPGARSPPPRDGPGSVRDEPPRGRDYDRSPPRREADRSRSRSPRRDDDRRRSPSPRRDYRNGDDRNGSNGHNRDRSRSRSPAPRAEDDRRGDEPRSGRDD
ncbi:hypothetical protein DB88DRAFT_481565 [Papiliotrema laurentii]|uniref:RRM domain-containing protein n=1 Tax=Papiliotrema laurentii TaxID=5418 RepID=A0AAD9L8C1_PAPLA|nr:hypothetical protein DB88DRAFT_481565 [Papiliotrema laurentii]